VILFSRIWDEVAGPRDFSPLERWGRELELTYPHVSAPRPVVLVYARQFMWDAQNLNAAGIEKFMPTVATHVQSFEWQNCHGMSENRRTKRRP